MISITLPVFGRTINVDPDQAVILVNGEGFGPNGKTTVKDLIEIIQESSISILRVYKEIPTEWWGQIPNTSEDDMKDLTAALTMLTVLLLALNGQTEQVKEVFQKMEAFMQDNDEGKE
jgi:hypothetical protein